MKGDGPFRETELTPPPKPPFPWGSVWKGTLGGMMVLIIPFACALVVNGFQHLNAENEAIENRGRNLCRNYCESQDWEYWQVGVYPDAIYCNCVQTDKRILHEFYCRHGYDDEMLICVYH